MSYTHLLMLAELSQTMAQSTQDPDVNAKWAMQEVEQREADQQLAGAANPGVSAGHLGHRHLLLGGSLQADAPPAWLCQLACRVSHAVLAASCRMHKLYHAQDASCTSCILHKLYHAQAVSCTCCIMHMLYHVKVASCQSCIMYKLYHARALPCTSCVTTVLRRAALSSVLSLRSLVSHHITSCHKVASPDYSWT